MLEKVRNARAPGRVYADMRHQLGRASIVIGLLTAACMALSAQSDPQQRTSHPAASHAPGSIIPMPADRADDSYAIYSLLMPGKTLASLPSNQGATWAIAEVTVNEAERNPRIPPQGQLKAPPDNSKGFTEAVGDYEANRYTRVQLNKDGFHLSHPFTMVNPNAAKSSGSPSVTYFSEVYFDSKHQAALVYMYEWCANLCASGTWIYLEKHGDDWQRRSGIVVPGA